MTNIETFDQISNQIVQYIYTAYNDLEKAMNICTKMCISFQSKFMGLNKNTVIMSSPDVNTNEKINAMIDILSQMATAGLLGLAAYCGVDIMALGASVSQYLPTGINIASKFIISAIGKMLYTNHQFKIQFTKTLKFTIVKSY